VILDRTVVAMHPHQFLSREHPGYAARPHLLQNLCAVTFACAMTRRDVFEKLHGLNEDDLAICYNDVDYCLRARELGYLVVFTPYALLRHFESKSRGMDESAEKQTRFKKEFDYMQRRHAEILKKGDPYYNPNLSLGVQSGFHIDPHYAEELPL
jgi:GT2 family glycosyltransferase